MAKFNYNNIYDEFRYGIGALTCNNTYSLGYLNDKSIIFNGPTATEAKIDYDGNMTVTLEGNQSNFIVVDELAGLFKGRSKNDLYRSHKEEIKRVIFNEPYTIVIWANGEKTIVKAQGGEPYDKEKGLAMCFAKYALGNTCRYFDFFKEVCDEVEEKADKKKPSKKKMSKMRK